MHPRLPPVLLVLALLAATAGAARGEEDVPRPTIDPALRPLAAWLLHDDPVLRALAAFELRHHARPGTVRLATEVLGREKDVFVLGAALGSLLDAPRPDWIAEGGALLPGLLLRLAEHEHPGLRARARELLARLSGLPGGRGVEAWRAWWMARRADLAREQAEILAARAEGPAEGGVAPAPGETRTTAAPPDGGVYEHVARLRQDGLEVCIVLDHTGSMGPVIGEARSRAAHLVRRLALLVPRFRAGLVTYDDLARLRIALTVDGEALAAAFGKVAAGGGGDYEEGVDKGVALALRQEVMGWSRAAWRVIVVIGDAPPHEGDVPGLLRRILGARDDVLYDHPVVVHTVSTQPGGVEHFGPIALAGGGAHVALEATGRLEAALVTLAFGAGFADRVGPWLEEMERLREAAPAR